MYWVFFICWLFKGFYLNAQELFSPLDLNHSKETVHTFDNRYSGVEGSPYIFNDWIPAKVEALNVRNHKSHLVSNVSVMIDAHKNLLFVKPVQSSAIITMDHGVQSLKLYQGGDSRNSSFGAGIDLRYNKIASRSFYDTHQGHNPTHVSETKLSTLPNPLEFL